MQTPAWAPTSTDTSFFDLRDYVGVLKRRRRLIALITVVALGLAVGYTFTQTKVYTGTAALLVQAPIQSLADTAQTTPINTENERVIMLSIPVAELALVDLDLQLTPVALLDKVEVTIPKDADVLEVRFSDPDPQIAARGAQAFAESYLKYKTDQAQAVLDAEARSLSARIDRLRAGGGNVAAIALLEERLGENRAIVPDPGEILIDASTPTQPTTPDLPLNLAIALFLGLFVGVIAAFVRERLDDRLRGRADLEETLGVPVMTMIPNVPSWRDRGNPYLVALEAPRAAAAEAYRTLRTSILVTAAGRDVKTLMVVSAVSGEGKSTTAANLAVVLAQADKRVVLISADLRRPRLHEFFGLGPDKGLSEVLTGDRRAWESLRSGKVDNLWIMSSGKVSEHPTELLQSETMRQLIADQREVVDFILIDCPPVLAVADALVLAPLVDAVLFVADAKASPRGAVIQARAQLDQVGARLLGAVLNNVDTGTGGYAYYGAPYGYEHPNGGQPLPGPLAAKSRNDPRRGRSAG